MSVAKQEIYAYAIGNGEKGGGADEGELYNQMLHACCFQVC